VKEETHHTVSFAQSLSWKSEIGKAHRKIYSQNPISSTEFPSQLHESRAFSIIRLLCKSKTSRRRNFVLLATCKIVTLPLRGSHSSHCSSSHFSTYLPAFSSERKGPHSTLLYSQPISLIRFILILKVILLTILTKFLKLSFASTISGADP
jgi:hypothetical protein